MKGFIEKRKYQRVKYPYALSASFEEASGKVKDISEHGLRIECFYAKNVDIYSELGLYCFKTKKTIDDIPTKNVWKRNEPPSLLSVVPIVEIGVEFVELSEDQQIKIRELINNSIFAE